MSNDDLVRVAGKIASLGPLHNSGRGSWWNPEAYEDNCVWVSVARSFMKTVPQLTAMVGMEAPSGGASKETIREFLWAVCTQDRSLVMFGDGDFEGLSESVVCYTRGDGSGHCVLRNGGRYLCFQHSDDGTDVTAELAKPGALIRFGWVFVKRTPTGASSPI